MKHAVTFQLKQLQYGYDINRFKISGLDKVKITQRINAIKKCIEELIWQVKRNVRSSPLITTANIEHLYSLQIAQIEEVAIWA
jgi:hypothetical protein